VLVGGKKMTSASGAAKQLNTGDFDLQAAQLLAAMLEIFVASVFTSEGNLLHCCQETAKY
jgi:hypothetical protein